MNNLDTYTTIKRFVSKGMTTELAEEIVAVMEEQKQQSNAVTKDDLKIGLVSPLILKTELKEDLMKLESKIDKSTIDLLKCMIPFVLAVIGLLIGIYLKLY